MATVIGTTPLVSKFETRKPIERKYFTKESIAMCFENPRNWVLLSDELVDKSYMGSLEKQAAKLGFELDFAQQVKGTKENGYAYRGLVQARYTPAESTGYAEALVPGELKKAKKAKNKAKKSLAQNEQAVAA